MHPSPLFTIGQTVYIVPADGTTSIASFVVRAIKAMQYYPGVWSYTYQGKGIAADQECLSSVAAYPVIGGAA